MTGRAEEGSIDDTVRKYYEISSTEEKGDSTTFRVPSFHLQPESNFSRLSAELDRMGYLCFTSTGDVDEIIVMPKPETKEKNDSRIKIALFIVTIISMLYFGYSYQASYGGGNNPVLNFLTSLVFYLLPISVIFAGREASKYVAMKRNGMQYSFPIFVPNPLGIGSMGTINTPNKPYVSRKAMIETGAFSIITGFLISVVFLILGSLTTYNFPPSTPIVKSPVQTIGSPLIMQLIVNRMIPSNGILDPLALAGWAGIVITAFNALPLGFLDGGLISSALFGKNANYLSYFSILVIVALGIIYPPWIILAVFALLVGLRGPQPLNNLSKVRVNSKAIAAVSFAIVVIGVAPFPIHAGANTFSASASQNYFLLYGNQNSVDFNVTVNNTGQSSIVPAFEFSSSVNFSLSGESRTIPPGSQINYSVALSLSNNVPLGFNNYQVTVYSGSYFKTMSISVLKVNVTPALSFNNTSPFPIHPGKDGNFTLNLVSSIPDSVYLVSIGGPNISFTYFLQANQTRIDYTSNLEYLLSSASPKAPYVSMTAGFPLTMNFKLNSYPQYWYIVAYDSQYNAAIAEYQGGQ